jgi:competence protein ComFB
MDLSNRHFLDSLVNEAEELVIREMERQLSEQADLCTCDECVQDIAAYALNKVRPRYRVSLLDTVYVDPGERSAYAREIEEAVSAAILTVKANPSHD